MCGKVSDALRAKVTFFFFDDCAGVGRAALVGRSISSSSVIGSIVASVVRETRALLGGLIMGVAPPRDLAGVAVADGLDDADAAGTEISISVSASSSTSLAFKCDVAVGKSRRGCMLLRVIVRSAVAPAACRRARWRCDALGS